MLTQRAPVLARFTRNDATRLGIATGILVLVLTAILGASTLTQETLQLQVGDLAPRDIVAQRALDFESQVRTADAREAARAAVQPH
jgi:membrane-associated HD superfamily phosphohydrolase